MQKSKKKGSFLRNIKGWARPRSPSGRNSQSVQPIRPPCSPTLIPVSSATTPELQINDPSLDPALRSAIEKFIAELSNEDKAAFQSTDDILARLQGQSNSQSGVLGPLGERVKKVLEGIKNFLGSVGPFFQFFPPAALVVGGINGVLSLLLGYMEFFEKIVAMMERIEEHLGYLSDYGLPVFQSSPNVQKALVGAYCDLLEFFVAVKGLFTKKAGRASYLESPKLFMKLSWEPFESKFKPIEDKFIHHALIVSRSATVQRLVNDDEDRLRKDREKKAKRRHKVLQWLSPIDFKQTHERNFKKRFGNTGEWLLRSPRFKDWENTPDASLLWCHGLPGTGKTVLASLVIEELSAQCDTSNDVGIAFIYCDYRYHEPCQATSYIKAAIKELCQRIDELPEELQKLYENGDNYPSYKELHALFLGAAKRFKKVFLVLDALDECIEQRRELISFLRDMVSATSTDRCVIKVFITSRKESDIQHEFSSFPIIEIEAKNVDADIKLYVTAQLEQLIQSKRLTLSDASLKDHILDQLVCNADGMFLWVELQLEHICTQVSDSGIRDALITLPENIEQTYSEMIERINKKPKAQRELARRIFMWMVYAQEILCLEELMYAVAIRGNTKSLKELESNVPSPKVMLDACANLIVLDNPTKHFKSKVRFVHFSIEEFLLRGSAGHENLTYIAREMELGSPNEEIARLCMTFLLYCSIEDTEDPLGYHYPLLFKYAFENWADHMRIITKISTDLKELIIKFFKCGVFLNVMGWGGSEANPAELSMCYCFQKPNTSFSPLTVALIYDLQILFKDLELQYKHIHYPDDIYAMHYAARHNSVIAAERLYKKEPRVDRLDDFDCQPLCKATGEEMAQFLLEHGADVNGGEGSHVGPLQSAVCEQNMLMVHFLLKNGADVNAQHWWGGSVLQSAAQIGNEEIVKVLMDHGADVFVQAGSDGNALQAAAYGGSIVVMQWFLDKGLDVNLRGGFFHTTLQAAAYKGGVEAVKFLLERGVDVNVQGGECGNALQAAASEDVDVVQLLLDWGADVNAQGGKYGNALLAAIHLGKREIVQLLLDRGADVNARGNQPRNPLQLAIHRGHESIAQLLRDKEAVVTENIIDTGSSNGGDSETHEDDGGSEEEEDIGASRGGGVRDTEDVEMGNLGY